MITLQYLIVCSDMSNNLGGDITYHNIYHAFQVPQVPFDIPMINPFAKPSRIMMYVSFRFKAEVGDEAKVRFKVKYEGLSNEFVIYETDLKFTDKLMVGNVPIMMLRVLSFGEAKFFCEWYDEKKKAWKEFSVNHIVEIHRLNQSSIIKPNEAIA